MRLTGNITSERLREVMTYDPATGVFVWLVDRKKAKVGARAGYLKNGYRLIAVDGGKYQASALAWFWVHGEWPDRNLRLKDGNRDNAAINNLTFGETDFSDKVAAQAYRRDYWQRNPQRAHAKRIKWNYGVALEQYQDMLLAQNGVCAICKKPETAAQNGRIVPLSVDHDHDDNSIRGLLCRRHNAMLGQGNDSEEILLAAVEYLRAHRAKPKTNIIPLAGRRIASVKGE